MPSNSRMPDSESATATKRRSLLRTELVASFGAVGVLIYVILRFPSAIFYGQLGATPEEVGLGYVQLLAQSSALVIVLAALAADLSFAIVFLIQLYKIAGARGKVMTDLTRPLAARMSDAEFAKALWAARQGMDEELKPGLDQVLLETARRRAKDRQSALWPPKDFFVPDPLLKYLRFIWRRMSPSLHRWFIGFSLLLAVGLMTWNAVIAAELTRECSPTGSFFGFEYNRQSVQLFNAATMTPAFPDRELLLLGGDSSRYVLFDCRNDATLRLPASNYLIIHTD